MQSIQGDLENLEVYEHSNGQIMIKNVTTHYVKNIEQVYDLLNLGVNLELILVDFC